MMTRVSPTPKASILAVLIVALYISSIIWDSFAGLMIASLLTMMMAYSYGYALKESRKLYRINAKRNHLQRAGEGSRVPVNINLNIGEDKWPPYIHVEDRCPPRLKPEKRELLLTPGDSKQAKAKYYVITSPGYHRFEATVLSTGDPLGFFRSFRVVKSPSSISVYPLGFGEYTVSAIAQGAQETVYNRLKGLETEFYQLREYVYGDDVRRISWTATARTGYPMVWEGYSTTKQDVALFLDLALEAWPGTPGYSSADWIMRLTLEVVQRTSRSGAKSWYTIYRGNTWEDWRELWGRQAVDVLRFRLSLMGPDSVEKDSTKYQALERFLINTPHGVFKIILLSTNTRIGEIVRLLELNKIDKCKVIIGIILPLGSSRTEKAIREAYWIIARKELDEVESTYKDRIHIIGSLPMLENFLRRIGRYVGLPSIC